MSAETIFMAKGPSSEEAISSASSASVARLGLVVENP